MNAVTLITWVSTAVGGLLFRAVKLIEHTSGFQGAAATCLPVPVVSARVRTTTCGSGSGSVQPGAMT